MLGLEDISAGVPDRRQIAGSCWRFSTCVELHVSHLVVDGRPKQDEKEAHGHHRQDTEEGGQEDGQPHVGLVQRVPGGTWMPKTAETGVKRRSTNRWHDGVGLRGCAEDERAHR